MQEMDELLEVADRLMSPEGCPWDREQTFLSLQPFLVEEAHEVLEAVDLDEDEKMIEELGDLLYVIVFYAKLAQRDERFSLKEIVLAVKEKLIRRHPHVFENLEVSSIDEVKENWERIKAGEKGKKRKALEAIPKGMPLLARAQKVMGYLERAGEPNFESRELSEEELGEEMMDLVKLGFKRGIDVEGAFRRALLKEEYKIREHSSL